MENYCGKVGHRTRKNRHLEATSRSIMIEGTKNLREMFGGSFRDYRKVALEIKDVKTKHNEKQETISGEKMSKKQTNNLKIEGRLLKQTQDLKGVGGPFTNTKDVDDYLGNDDIDEKEKSRRMKLEIMFARDTSLSVPKSNSVFRIRTMKVQGKKSRQLSSQEFGNNLKMLLDIKCSALDKTISIKTFIQKLDDIYKS